jgi:hypothetical protein
MLQAQPRNDFFGRSFSVLLDDDGCCVAVMRNERYTKLLAGADDLRQQLLAAVTLLETLTPALDVSEMNKILIETGERQR